MKKGIIAIILVLSMMLPMVACQKDNQSTDSSNTQKQTQELVTDKNGQTIPTLGTQGAVVNGAKVTIKDTCVYLIVGTSHLLQYTTEKNNVAKKNIVWYASNDCVSVKDGIVIAKKEGYAYVSANGGNECLICILPKNMPTLSVNTNNQAINSKETYTTCSVSLNTDNSDYCFGNVSAGIRLRGNSTSGYPKKPYRIKFDSKINLLGMNSGNEFKSWVLLAEWLDDSLLRNAVSLSLASMILGEYSSDWRYISLKINGEFKGIYLLAEQSQINKNRINIEEAGTETTSLMSGYLFEVDASTSYNSSTMFRIYHDGYDIRNLEGEEFTWTCNDNGEMLQYISLKNDGYSNDQLMFTKYYLRAVFDIIYNATYNNKALVFKQDFLDDPNQAEEFLAACKDGNDFKNGLVETDALTPQEAVERIIDIESLARMYIFSEMVCNNDDLKKSFYFWVDFSADGNGKLTFGCPWDHDGAIVAWPGNSKDYSYRNTEKYFAAKRNPWYVMIMCNEWFVDIVKEQWQDLYDKNNAYQSVVVLIPNISTTYSDAFEQEKQTWSSWRTNDQLIESEKTEKWIAARVAWMNTQFGTNAE